MNLLYEINDLKCAIIIYSFTTSFIVISILVKKISFRGGLKYKILELL